MAREKEKANDVGHFFEKNLLVRIALSSNTCIDYIRLVEVEHLIRP